MCLVLIMQDWRQQVEGINMHFRWVHIRDGEKDLYLTGVLT